MGLGGFQKTVLKIKKNLLFLVYVLDEYSLKKIKCTGLFL